MHQTDYVSHHSFNTVIKNDVRAQRLITVTLNPKKIVNSDVKCRSLWYKRMRSNRWSTLLCIGWSQVALWKRTPSSKRNPNHLSWNKVIRNILIDVNLIELIILKLKPECFSGIYWNFVLRKVKWKSHSIQKGYIM
jgi:hypothetical protein